MKQTKEIAEELIGKYIEFAKRDTDLNFMRNAKKCALICCDEIIKEIPMYTGNLNPNWKFWQAVKKELIK